MIKESKQRTEERELLDSIVIVSNNATAGLAKDILSHEKNVYNFDVYLCRLSELLSFLMMGIPEDSAIELVKNGF